MAYPPESPGFARPISGIAQAAALDQGLRAYMLRVYNWMSSGLVLTGLVAYAIANTSLIGLFYTQVMTESGHIRVQPTGLGMLSMFAPLAFVMVMSFGVNKLSRTAAQGLYWAFCVAMGASLTNIFLMYTGTSIATTFFVTGATFASMSIWGYTTKGDLSKMGSFLMMGLFGMIIASIINIFVHSSAMQFMISIIGVVVFTGLTAYDTQRIKVSYLNYAYAEGEEGAAKRSVYDALNLYLNFINLFMILLQFTGSRNNNS